METILIDRADLGAVFDEWMDAPNRLTRKRLIDLMVEFENSELGVIAVNPTAATRCPEEVVLAAAIERRVGRRVPCTNAIEAWIRWDRQPSEPARVALVAAMLDGENRAELLCTVPDCDGF